MESRSYYLTFEIIQNQLTLHKNRFHAKISVAEAILQLHQEQKTFTTRPDVLFPQDISACNALELRELYRNIPIDVTTIVNQPDTYSSFVSEAVSMFSTADIMALFLMTDEANHLHYHDFFEVDYVLSGKGTLHFESEVRTLQEGEFCIISPDTKHDLVVEDDSIIFDMLIKKSNFDTAFSSLMRNDNVLSSFFYNGLYQPQNNYLLFMTPVNTKIIYLLQNILMESVSTSPHANVVCTSYINILFSEVLRSHNYTHGYYLPKRSANMQMPVILSYIKSNFKHATLNAVAAFFNYDAAYLGKQIKTFTGVYFNELVNRYKIEYAILIMKSTTLSLFDISESSGFHSVDHFSRTFKKLKGVPPKIYRAQIQANGD